MSIRKILDAELDKIRLSEEDVVLFREIADEFILKLEGAGLKAFVGGSLAKGTMIKKRVQDIDIFVVFDYSEDILELEGFLKKVDLSQRDDPKEPDKGKLKKIHGSRDYFHVVYPNVVLEIVPVVKNSDPELAENVTDVSLSHVKYVSGEISKNPELAGEIMLAKAFCRANRLYGAEGYVRGFSGYSLECLVIYFGSFLKFLKGIAKKTVIDPCKYFGSEREVMREINSSKLQGPVVLVDPTYKYRNVCAGLGFETYEKFLKVALKFLKKPSLDFFEKKELDVDSLKELAKSKKARFLKLKFTTDRQEGDIAGTKMRKMFRFFVRELDRRGQKVLRSEFDYTGRGQEAFGYLVVLEKDEVERRGPSVGLEDQARAFCKANEGAFKKKGYWWVNEKVSVERVLGFVKEKEKEMGCCIFIEN